VHYVTREYLHQLVWESPVSEVAAAFGVSDVGLAKACRRSAIPIPPRGYWVKLEAGNWIDPAPPGTRPYGSAPDVSLPSSTVASATDS
jgi:hypothetical protein